MRYAQGRLVDCARVDLTAASMAGARVADIATRWGLASQAHFTRLFRALGGCTPSEVRPPEGPGGYRRVAPERRRCRGERLPAITEQREEMATWPGN